MKEITEKHIHDIDSCINKLEKIQSKQIDNIIDTLNDIKVNEIVQLYNETNFKTYDTITDFVIDNEKKAVYIQIEKDIFIYIDYDRNYIYSYHNDKVAPGNLYDMKSLIFLHGDDVTLLDPPKEFTETVRKDIMQG